MTAAAAAAIHTKSPSIITMWCVNLLTFSLLTIDNKDGGNQLAYSCRPIWLTDVAGIRLQSARPVGLIGLTYQSYVAWVGPTFAACKRPVTKCFCRGEKYSA